MRWSRTASFGRRFPPNSKTFLNSKLSLSHRHRRSFFAAPSSPQTPNGAPLRCAYGVSTIRSGTLGREPIEEIPQGRELTLNETLARELEVQPGDALIVRVTRPSTVPREAVLGRRTDTVQTLRLTLKAILPDRGLGRFGLKPTSNCPAIFSCRLRPSNVHSTRNSTSMQFLFPASRARPRKLRVLPVNCRRCWRKP